MYITHHANCKSYIINKEHTPKSVYNHLHKKHYPIIKMKQIHSEKIKIISIKPTTFLTTIPNVDGLITTQPNVTLAVKMADCMPIVIYHPNKILCVLHAGRKGTDLLILKKAIIKLKQLSNSNTNFTIWFGPHICNNCYEIDSKKNIHYSLFKKNIHQLKQELSLTRNTLTISNVCTKCNDTYYSYRGDNFTKKRNYICSLITT